MNAHPVFVRAAAGMLLATTVAFAAYRTRALTASGVIAAITVAAVCAAAGWGWAVLLVAFFLSSIALSAIRSDVRSARVASVVAKGGARDAGQVFANGSIFTAAALMSLLLPWDGWTTIGAGALAAATSDTWSTEMGTLARRRPRSILSGRELATGASGGVTPLGFSAAFSGALFIACSAWIVGWTWQAVLGALVGGFAGSTADSVIGAALQGRRRCSVCDEFTERSIHVCGNDTIPAGGIAWLDNDVVNLMSTLVGACVAALLS